MLWPSVLLAEIGGGLDEMGGLPEPESGGGGMFLRHLLQGYFIVDID